MCVCVCKGEGDGVVVGGGGGWCCRWWGRGMVLSLVGEGDGVVVGGGGGWCCRWCIIITIGFKIKLPDNEATFVLLRKTRKKNYILMNYILESLSQKLRATKLALPPSDFSNSYFLFSKKKKKKKNLTQFFD